MNTAEKNSKIGPYYRTLKNKHLTTKNTVSRDCLKLSNLTISDFRIQRCRE